MFGVRAKMKCESIELHSDGSGSVSLSPVISGSEENERFYKQTPSGGLKLSTINAAAIKQFELGKEFYVDITPAGQVAQPIGG